MSRTRSAAAAADSAANLGFEAQLWAAADLLRGNIESAEYKHVVLGLIFLKYVSDAFEERRAQLLKEQEQDAGVDPDDPEEYAAKAVFFLPEKARWSYLKDNARRPEIGELVDAAMKAVEDSNPKRLRGVLPRDYARPALDKARLGQVIDLMSNLGVGGTQHRSKDTLGRVYEYFLGRFASAEGRRGGEFYTPSSVVRLLVEMLEPRENTRIYDPCCGSGGMFVQSEKFIETHGGRRLSAAVYGQELNHTTWRLCRMNLAIRGIEADIREGDTFAKDLHPDLKADYVIANPPFNMSEWGGRALAKDARWAYGTPPPGNANYAWIQHFVHHLKPDGVAGFVMANGSLSSNQSGEGEIRQKMVEADLVDCIVALPAQLFYTTQIPVCLWFLTRDKTGRNLKRGTPHRPGGRRGETLFIDARKFGTMETRTLRALTGTGMGETRLGKGRKDDGTGDPLPATDIGRIVYAYRQWRGEPPPDWWDVKQHGEWSYCPVPGFCLTATVDEIAKHGFVLTPGRYVGAEEAEDDGQPFEEKCPRLVSEVEEHLAEGERLTKLVRERLRGLSYGDS